jgi:hypothetical protein
MPFNNELEQKSILTQDDRYFPLLIPKKRMALAVPIPSNDNFKV